MQKDFHYCAMYVLAVEAGFTRSDAAIIAYASQYVDDATEGEPVALSGGQIFDAVRTAHVGLQSFDWDVQKKIYMPFHFLPNVVRREHRRRFSYVTRPARLDAEPRCLAQLLFDQAADEPDTRLRLVRLGVALHAVADTFAHCGFSGRQGSENDVEAIETARDGGGWDLHWLQSATDVLRPRIGHAEAQSYPDEPFRTWRYRNGAGRPVVRDNGKLFRAAAGVVLTLLKRASGAALPAGQTLACPRRVDELLRCASDETGRCRQWQRSDPSMPPYDPEAWRSAALGGDVRWDRAARPRQARMLARVAAKPGFERSLWALFHRAAFLQRAWVWQWIN